MRFFDRTKEITLLHEIHDASRHTAQFTVLTGRRRIGKTSLILHAYNPEKILYFFVARKVEKELSTDFAREVKEKLNLPQMGSPARVADVFEYVMKIAYNQNITLFIDEFQEFFSINASIFSEIQRIWDLHKDKSKINLIVGGSINSLMHKIFQDKNEPLYQRMTKIIKLKAFTPKVLKEIMEYYAPGYDRDDLLALYSFSGGVAKYVELFVDNRVLTKEKMVEFMINDSSTFIDEGKVILTGEFGKDYGRYFSILSAIASGYTVRSRIENIIGVEISGYLTRLETDYELISKRQPLFEMTSNKNVHYMLADNFLTFWFRYIYKYNYLTEIGNYRYLREIIERDYDVFSGIMLERYFKQVFVEKEEFTRIGSWWDRKGENEIDIIAVDDFRELIEFYEVKRNPEKINIGVLQAKADKFFDKNPVCRHFERQYKALSISDM